MPNTRIVVAQGTIDGVNTIFATGTPYVPGSTAYILNGRIHNQKTLDSPFGYVELDPDLGTIQVANPPLLNDVVQIFFWDRIVTPPPPIQQLTGTVVAGATPIQGVVAEAMPTRLTGVVGPRTLQGVIRPERPEQIVGEVSTGQIRGIVREKCP